MFLVRIIDDERRYFVAMETLNVAQELERISTILNRDDIMVVRKRSGLKLVNVDIASQDIVLTICHQGTARVMYDMREISYQKNSMSIIMPGHIIKYLEYSPDLVITRVFISHELFPELKAHLLSHGYDKFYLNPLCTLDDVQMERLLKIVDLLAHIADHDIRDLQLRRHLLIAQLSVGYEFVNYYRREQDKGIVLAHSSQLYNDFCNLVAEHYLESREVKYYAKLLHLSPKHFSKLITRETGGKSPADCIENFIVAHAKRLIDTKPECSLGEISYMLGFSEPSSFYRYFKRVTGMTAKQYRHLSRP